MAGEVERVRAALRAVEEIEDPAERAAACSELLHAWPQLHRQVADVRQQAVNEAHDDRGMTYVALGRRMGGITGEAVGQIARGRGRARTPSDGR
ncbi:hypothetical protein FCH28_09675 [Streptomyces piniterrae]|uniref:Uncharacterized protein n=1 Tax=Streptomyces piniterrae TaxID=2571125 RepID=A0A4U0NMG2_9ACTN|nr:hypothetical protein [Streptomyces piniterrae]TJZ55599.1 hypothetical protein FCH28_09675 [Streptomyces piniterrae]